VLPAQPSGPGRPREFCSDDCRGRWHYTRTRERREAERREARERARYEFDLRVFGKRHADRAARERAEKKARW
jgi:hypothetical protein